MWERDGNGLKESSVKDTGSGSMMGIDSPEEPMVTDRRGIVLISFPQAEPVISISPVVQLRISAQFGS